jgi:ribonuclease P protein component
MFPKKNRLKKEKDFRRIIAKGKIFREDILFLRMINNDLGINRIGVSVSKKISKKATQRNKQKRTLSDLLKENVSDAKCGLDIFLIARPGIEKKNNLEVEFALKKILDKAKVLKHA